MQERQSLLNTLSSMNRKVVKLQAEKETLSTRISKAQGDHAKEIVVYVRGKPDDGGGERRRRCGVLRWSELIVAHGRAHCRALG